MLFRSFRKAEKIHKKDRRSDESPYILHPIWLVEAVINSYPDQVDPHDVMVLMLHDTIEDHPECWRDIFDTFGFTVFCDVLVLSKIRFQVRQEMLRWFVQFHGSNNPVIIKVFHILHAVDPVFKFEKFSLYKENLLGKNSIRFKNALILYKKEILDRYKDQCEAQDEYISLGNYLYFDEKDARRKLQDMLHNMSDMEAMEIKNPGYIEKRRIKAYILGVKLKNYEMDEEYSQLEGAFLSAGFLMYTDDEVSSKILDWEDTTSE